ELTRGRRPGSQGGQNLLLPEDTVRPVVLDHRARILPHLRPVAGIQRGRAEVVHAAQGVEIGEQVALGKGDNGRAPAEDVVPDQYGAVVEPEGQVVSAVA